MIGEIEAFEAELEAVVLDNGKLLEHREISIEQAGADHGVAADVPEGERGRQLEGGSVKPALGTALTIGQSRADTGGVGALIADGAGVGGIDAADDIDGKTGLDGGD
jgi:hypothetical protein